jgi:hypothetical protein
LTGGGKYDPDDIRFQILYRLFSRVQGVVATLLARTFRYARHTSSLEMSNGLPDDLCPST